MTQAGNHQQNQKQGKRVSALVQHHRDPGCDDQKRDRVRPAPDQGVENMATVQLTDWQQIHGRNEDTHPACQS